MSDITPEKPLNRTEARREARETASLAKQSASLYRARMARAHKTSDMLWHLCENKVEVKNPASQYEEIQTWLEKNTQGKWFIRWDRVDDTEEGIPSIGFMEVEDARAFTDTWS